MPMTTDIDGNSLACASLVVEHTVPKGEGLAFRWWHRKLTQSAKGFKGYIRTDLYAPVKGSEQLKWYSIVHFQSSENLNQWLRSRDRESLIESGRSVFESYRFMSFATGLEGWFSPATGGEQLRSAPPPWKQNLSVILGLYPVVMVQTLLFNQLGVMQGWSLGSAMVVNNILTSSILTWVVMPFVSRGLRFWLQPAAQPDSWKINAIGAGAVTGALLLMVAFFNGI
jgi:antibiotic biosynthesis monooxygenase (ABM) superfamily enzyme